MGFELFLYLIFYFLNVILHLDGNGASSAEERFQDVMAEHQRDIQRHLNKQTSAGSTGSGVGSQSSGGADEMSNADLYESSEEEDSLDDENILQSMLRSFQGTGVGK